MYKVASTGVYAYMKRGIDKDFWEEIRLSGDATFRLRLHSSFALGETRYHETDKQLFSSGVIFWRI
jgi:hypothetical protein